MDKMKVQSQRVPKVLIMIKTTAGIQNTRQVVSFLRSLSVHPLASWLLCRTLPFVQTEHGGLFVQ